MATMIRPNRLEVSDRFPIAGFTVKTDSYPWFEVALATDPALFRAERKSQRTYSNFYSSRAIGPLSAERGEAVYLVPPEVLKRFAGQPKLYFSLATFSDANRSRAEALQVPSEGSPWLNLKLFTGRGSRRMMALPHPRNGHARNGNGYAATNADELVWAGDAAQPGREAIAASPPPPPASAPASGSTTSPASSPTPPNTSASAALGYDDGFGPMPLETTTNPDDVGIEGPIPDERVTAQTMAYSRALTAAEYPQASRFVQARWYRTPATPRTISRIVIHITDGGPNINNTISWFQNPLNDDGSPRRVSAHYIVGQNGEVVQMVKHSDVAQHAGNANSDSIGIEHNARTPGEFGKNDAGLYPTETQYCNSAALVRWLCEQYGIPMDRDHILGHSEADPNTTHQDCPNGVWDWDYYMGLVTSASCYPRPSATSSALSYDLYYDVPLIPQPNQFSCWAASMAMLVSFRRQASITPESLAQEVGRSLRTSYSWDMLEAVKDHFGFRDIPLPSNASLYLSPDQWQSWLNTYGPLWVTTVGNPSHAIIVHGISGDLTPAGTTIHILNPWDTTKNFDRSNPIDFNPPNYGQKYSQSFAAFAADFGNLGLSNYGRWRVLYLPPYSTQGQSLEGQFGRANGRGIPPVRPFNTGQSFDVDWKEDIYLVPQLTGMSCWAASAAMVVGWRNLISVNPEEIARGAGQWAAYTHGLNVNDVDELANAWGLKKEWPQSYTIEGFRQLLENNGPLWIGMAVPSGHAVVVTGLYGDGTPEGTFVRYNDPWPVGQGRERQVKNYRQFMQEYENFASADTAGNANIQIIHANGRRPLTTSQGYATGYSSRVAKPVANRRARSFSDEAATNGALSLKEADYSEEIGEAADLEQDVMASGEKAALTNEEIYRIIREVATADSGEALYSAVSTDQASQLGLAYGLVLFTQHSGRLGRVLQLMQRREAATFAEIFGPESETLLAVTNAATPQERLQFVGGEPLWSTAWIEKFRRAGEVPAFQAAQNEEAIEGLFRPLLKIASRLGLISDRGLAMAYDRVVTRGLGGGLRWLVQAAGALRTAAQRQHALQMLGYENLAQFQAAVGDIPQNGIFGPETHAALIAALRQQGAAILPSLEELICRLVAATTGTAKKRLMRLRDSDNLRDSIYNLS